MSGDDTLFESGQEGGAAPKAAPDFSAIDERISHAVAGAIGPVATTINDLSRQVQTIASINNAQQSAPREEPGAPTPTEAEELRRQFWADPAGFVEKLASKKAEAQLTEVTKNQLGPFLRSMIEDRFSELVESNKARVDAEYGAGTFDELIAPELGPVFDNMNPEGRGNSKVVEATIRGVMGFKIPQLMERAAKAKAQPASDRGGAPNMPFPGGRPGPRRAAPGQLSNDEKAVLAEIERFTGEAMDPKDYARARDMQIMIDDQGVDDTPRGRAA